MNGMYGIRFDFQNHVQNSSIKKITATLDYQSPGSGAATTARKLDSVDFTTTIIHLEERSMVPFSGIINFWVKISTNVIDWQKLNQSLLQGSPRQHESGMLSFYHRE